MKQTKIFDTYVSKEGIIITVYRPKKQPRPVTAKPKGSSRHYGRVNAFGVRV